MASLLTRLAHRFERQQGGAVQWQAKINRIDKVDALDAETTPFAMVTEASAR